MIADLIPVRLLIILIYDIMTYALTLRVVAVSKQDLGMLEQESKSLKYSLASKKETWVDLHKLA